MLVNPVYFFMTLNSCVVTCQERTVSLFLFWILLTRSMYSCFLTLFSRLLKTERKKNPPNPQSNPFFCLQTFLPDEGREGHRNLCMRYFPGYWSCCQAVPHLSMLTSLNTVVCPLRADSATKHPLLEAVVLMEAAEWKMWSGGSGAFTACLIKLFNVHRGT